MSIRLRFHGAARTVTGSCYGVFSERTRLLVDCGLYQERDLEARNWDPFPVPPDSIDAVLLTHGHLLYTKDVEFQRYRKTKWPIYRALDAFLPGFIENALAERFILKSKQVISAKEPWRLQFSEEAIEENFSQGIEAIICGHSHHTVIKRYDGNKYFIVIDETTFWPKIKWIHLKLPGPSFTLGL